MWGLGYQLGFFSIIGIYAFSVKTKPFLILYGILAIFNSFCVIGQFTILGYTMSLVTANQADCLTYFGPNVTDSRCDGFMGLLRVIGLFAIFAQWVVAFLWFVFYFDPSVDHPGFSRIENEKKGFEPHTTPAASGTFPTTTPTPSVTIYQSPYQSYQAPPASTTPPGATHNYSEI